MTNKPSHCPECGAALSTEEQESAECWSCGWPQGVTPLAELGNMPPGFDPDNGISTQE
ncbi:MAG: hypothetical protein ACT4OJ_14160 [Bacteroidota bacterium]